MDLFGTTRSRVRRSHALIAPTASCPRTSRAGSGSRGVILIAPRMGARFTQYLALMEAGGTAGPAPPGVERVLYVLEGEVALTLPARGRARPGARRVRVLPAGRRRRAACGHALPAQRVREAICPPARHRRSPGRSAATSETSPAPRSWAIPTRSSRCSCRPTRGSTSR